MTPAELKTTRLRLGFRSRRTLAGALGCSTSAVEHWEYERYPINPIVPKFLALFSLLLDLGKTSEELQEICRRA